MGVNNKTFYFLCRKLTFLMHCAMEASNTAKYYHTSGKQSWGHFSGLCHIQRSAVFIHYRILEEKILSTVRLQYYYSKIEIIFCDFLSIELIKFAIISDFVSNFCCWKNQKYHNMLDRCLSIFCGNYFWILKHAYHTSSKVLLICNRKSKKMKNSATDFTFAI